MGERAPESKELEEVAPSFEQFTQKVKKAMELMRMRDLLNPYDRYYAQRRGGPIRKVHGLDIGGPGYYKADLDAVKVFPEFEELIAEEQDILASGASKQEIAKYNTIAERAYERKEEVLEPIEKQLEDLRRDYAGPGDFIYRAAEILHRVSPDGRTWDTELENALLRDKFAELQRKLEWTKEREKNEKESAAFQEQFGPRYRELLKDAQEALKGQRMAAELNVMGETARARGFVSKEEMWLHYVEALGKLKDEVGEDKFKQLEFMNRTR